MEGKAGNGGAEGGGGEKWWLPWYGRRGRWARRWRRRREGVAVPREAMVATVVVMVGRYWWRSGWRLQVACKAEVEGAFG